MKLEPEGGLVMLSFLATLSTAVAAVFLVQALDIEGVKQAKRRVSPAAKTEASYPNGAVAGL
jgi:hypothetical protein